LFRAACAVTLSGPINVPQEAQPVYREQSFRARTWRRWLGRYLHPKGRCGRPCI
jgi:hypothetical protein